MKIILTALCAGFLTTCSVPDLTCTEKASSLIMEPRILMFPTASAKQFDKPYCRTETIEYLGEWTRCTALNLNPKKNRTPHTFLPENERMNYIFDHIDDYLEEPYEDKIECGNCGWRTADSANPEVLVPARSKEDQTALRNSF